MKSIFLAGIASLVVLGAAEAATVNLLSVSGTTSPQSPAFDAVNSPGAAGVGFSVGSNLTGLSFSIDYTCAGACLIDAYLVNSIGPGTSLSNVVGSTTLDGSSSLAFSGINLSAGDYAIILATDVGIWSWNASAAPTVVSNGISPINSLLSLSATFNSALPYASTFTALTSLAFMYSIDQTTTPSPPTPSPVPLGPTAPLAASGLGLLALVKRNKRAG